MADSIQDQALKQWAQSKGWRDVDSLVKSAYNLERLVGAPADQVIRLPGGDDDGSGARQVLQRLGLPESPDGYELPTPNNLPVDNDFMNWARSTFHEAGLTAAQAKAVVSKFNEYSEGQVSTTSEQAAARAASEEQQLRREWGNGYDRHVRMAKVAAQQLGFDSEALDAIEQAKGFAGTMKLMADLGRKLGEDQFVNADVQRQGFSSQMTPEEARSAWNSLTADPEKAKALNDRAHPAHKDLMERKRHLFEVMYPGE